MKKEKKSGILNASQRDGVDYRKATLVEMFIGMANQGGAVGFYLLMGFASMIGGQGYGIAGALVGLILTGLRIFDGFQDTLIALIFDKFSPRKGKIRILLLAGWAICILGSYMLYNWCVGVVTGIPGVLLFIACYLVFNFGYSLNGVASGTIAIVLSNDPTQRPMLNTVGTLYSYLTPILLTNILTFVILPRHNNQYDTAMFAEMITWFAVITLLFTLLACIGIRKVDIAETFASVGTKDKEEKVGLRDMIAVLKDNRAIQMYLFTTVSDKLTQQVSTQSVINNLLAGVLIGSYAASTMAQSFSSVVGIIFAFASGIYIAKNGAKKATVIFSWFNIGIAAFTLVFFLLLGGADGMSAIGKMWSVPFFIYVVICILKSGANMALTTTGNSMKADVVDYEYERSGKYMPGVVSGVYSLIDKIVSSFGSTIAMFSIGFVGYTGTKIPQMGDAATPDKFWMCMFLTLGMPILGWIINLIAMRFYKLDRERMIEVQKNLNARKEAAQVSNK